ncbi:hypothetical protein FSP39_018232 [Pinctada imbricata]|uniref:Uncharacterized protein n=1 Tax=Pinctada imbricata TaxID=66713 RepID=A0AA88Y025_PINIB|nr:hypothetical protein FSP39_018232 [Pinctada imbricata]
MATALQPADLLYIGKLFYSHCRKKSTHHEKRRKGNVCLRKLNLLKNDEIKVIYSLWTGKTAYSFRAEDVLFFEQEEMEYADLYAGILGCHRRSNGHSPFFVVTFVFRCLNNRVISLSLLQRQTEKPNIDEDNRIQVLYQCLVQEFEYMIKRSIELKTENGERIRELMARHLVPYCPGPIEHTSFSSMPDKVADWLKGHQNGGFSNFSDFTHSDQLIPEKLSASDHENNNSDVVIPEGPSDLPPPPPCNPQLSNTETPIVQLPLPCRPKHPELPDPSQVPKIPRKGILRAESLSNVLDMSTDAKEPHYINMSYPHAEDDHVYYYRYYVNIGRVRVKGCKMEFKIQRRSRLSDHMEDINFEAVDHHEKYYEARFQTRRDDSRYQRIFEQNTYSYVRSPNITQRMNFPPDRDKEDDPYWSSNICLYIQSLFQRRTPPNLYRLFDLTQGQYANLAVMLDVTSHVRRCDWTHFAQWIGIKALRDIEIIQHFSYTYKYLAMDIVLGYWEFQYSQGKNVPPCTFDQLRNIVMHIERQDVLRILNQTDTNPQEDEFSDEENDTYL